MAGEQVFLTNLGRKSHQLLYGRRHRLPGSLYHPGNKVTESRRTFFTRPMVKFSAQTTKYIYLPKVQQCISPRRNWDPQTPSPPASVYPRTKGGGP